MTRKCALLIEFLFLGDIFSVLMICFTLADSETETDKKITCVELCGGVHTAQRTDAKFLLASVYILLVSIMYFIFKKMKI